MIKTSLITIFFLVISHPYFAQYAPLQLGNVWVYQNYTGSRGRAEIVDSSFIVDSIKYYGYAFSYQSDIVGLIRLREDGYYVSKEDSTFPEPLNERIYYKKNAQIGDTWQVNYGVGGGGIATYIITDTIPAYILDTLVTGKILNENFALVEWIYTWSEEFGKLAKFDWQGETQHYLVGCVIDGIVYGDTTLVTDMNDFVSEISYSLYQNYPNPFNFSTIINISIPTYTRVLLEVYNVLGERIKILIDDFLTSGKHTVSFKAENLSSGVYFYVLRTNELVQTKKMLLMR